MTAIPGTRVMQVAGLALFAAGAILLAVGTSSIGLFVLYALLTFGGVILVLAGKKLQQRSLR
ncbi:hypothetical protein ACFFGH_09965 [Lysobacter korlensis]|uniref:Uncharacterized protein n=1 Tax=Lysobacter korlensis TaxID=553636 RepID=A0ABV6RMF4_9GAMM